LRDEGDNFLIELAIAGNAKAIVTHNIKDLTSGELVFPKLSIVTPDVFLEQLS
jgi:predicted nucleic acid-binding protein